ncbi:hypothetical protein K443DRAFT_483697 [Laccaria amethystina LaAM-08-1]|uniref:Uncharacterized protein n=1 Tax=Laccaria amethystina LaAM-08-1 TaxID=1095629 RepID=A0A0C9Y568_9AGAR|nr:hypothetical protein K443DRAFT_483697 [Laccaria amethystina LaAM-08-1]
MHSSLLRRALASLQVDTCLACSTSRWYSSKGSWEWRREKTPWRNVEAWNQEPSSPKEPKRKIGRPKKEQTPNLTPKKPRERKSSLRAKTQD